MSDVEWGRMGFESTGGMVGLWDGGNQLVRDPSSVVSDEVSKRCRRVWIPGHRSAFESVWLDHDGWVRGREEYPAVTEGKDSDALPVGASTARALTGTVFDPGPVSGTGPVTPVPATVPMTRERFGRYVRECAVVMRLGHWAIETPDEAPKDETCWAAVRCWDGQFGATVRVNESLFREPEETIRECAAHELVHCHLAHADRLAEEWMGKGSHEAWRVANEYAVSALAGVIAPLLPSPSRVLDREGGGDG